MGANLSTLCLRGGSKGEQLLDVVQGEAELLRTLRDLDYSHVPRHWRYFPWHFVDASQFF
jgi:hypothetical protein